MGLTILVRITAVPGKEELLEIEMKKLINITRAEPGCTN
ncbi:putative quinol monooxygenase [Shimia abyssi]|uniref:Antibiotic biosynthesis monooxygenase n=1 Tax=Shimia abyssi TaxID=1662395 RepID=A0A2P8F9W2_9RHOB|nr:hypothetical protein CLV88_11064 [Shimia abyssi]